MMRRRRKLSIEPSQTTIESLSHDGRGISHIDGKITFIHNAFPEETVTFKYTNQHRSYDEGYAFKIYNHSKIRISPVCPHFYICGGCMVQNMHHNAQVKHKEMVFLEQLKHFGNVEPKEILPPLLGPIFGYREKARLGVRYVPKKENSVLVGFRERNGRFVAEINSCAIMDDRIGKKIHLFRDLFDSLEIREFIPQMEVACSHDKIALVIRHLCPFGSSDIEKIFSFAKEHNFDIYFQSGGPETVHKVFPNDGNERLTYSIPDHEVELKFHPCDFTQVNSAMNRQMINRAIALLDPQPNERILDLFCGIGNFTIPVAQYCKSITGIEGGDSLVKRAKENMAHNNLDNVEFFTADLTSDISSAEWANKKYDKIIIDPPRSGAEEIIAHFPKFNAFKIVYISCNPATLARDIGELVKQGYVLEKAGIMDMFPHTAHVESIALLTRPY